jgi:hypothetical protein
MVWECFTNERRQNLNDGFQHENKGKCPRGKLRSRWKQRFRKYVTQKKESKDTDVE